MSPTLASRFLTPEAAGEMSSPVNFYWASCRPWSIWLPDKCPLVVSFQKDLKVSWIDPELKSFMSLTPFIFRETESFIRPFYGWRKLKHESLEATQGCLRPARYPCLFPLSPLIILHLGAARGSPLPKAEDKFPNTGWLV